MLVQLVEDNLHAFCFSESQSCWCSLGAITVLSKHNSLLQLPESHVAGVAASIQNVMQKHASMLSGVLTHSERKAVSAFVQAPADYFDAEPTFKQSYAPQSGAIFGNPSFA